MTDDLPHPALTDDDVKVISNVWNCEDSRLLALIEAGKLDPKKDFIRGDFRGWPLAGQDVRGIDFTGSDLRGTGINRAIRDETTILTDAILDDLSPLNTGFTKVEYQGAITDKASERAWKVLERCALLQALGERERIELAAHAEPRTFAANQPIFHVGEPGNNMMCVVVGTVRISMPAPQGRDIILADLPAGELFGEIAMLDGKPRSANATALTNCELLVLERRDVLPFLQRSPTACFNLMQLLCSRIRRSDERTAEIAFFDLPARLARVLLRYPAPDRGPLRISLSQRELAEMTGSTRENINRCLRDWQRRGILELKNRWTVILKPEALRGFEERSTSAGAATRIEYATPEGFQKVD